MMPFLKEGEEVPDEYYTAVSWMDSCHGRLNLTTREDVHYAHLSLQTSNTEQIVQDKITRKTFEELIPQIEPIHFGCNLTKGFHQYRPTKDQMKAFIQLRLQINTFHKNRPVYFKVNHLSKEELIDSCMTHLAITLQL